MTKRPLNECLDCGDTWYPRGRNLSRKCNNCGSSNVDIVAETCAPQRRKSGLAGCLALIIVLGVGGFCLMSAFEPTIDHSTSSPKPPRQSSREKETEVKEEDVGPKKIAPEGHPVLMSVIYNLREKEPPKEVRLAIAGQEPVSISQHEGGGGVRIEIGRIPVKELGYVMIWVIEPPHEEVFREVPFSLGWEVEGPSVRILITDETVVLSSDHLRLEDDSGRVRLSRPKG